MITCGGCPHPQSLHTQDDGDCTVLHCGCHWTAPTAEYPIMLPTDLIDGEMIICGDCGRPLTLGAPYSERLLGMNGDRAVIEVVCVYCTST